MKSHSKKILIVEDDRIISMVLERMIEKMNHKIVGTVISGREAVQAAQEHNPDLILMDIKLKDDMDGIDAMNEIHENSPVSVIYITGNSDQNSIARAKESGYSDYLVKPIRMEDLKEAVQRAFDA